jgi:hypothetical protein
MSRCPSLVPVLAGALAALACALLLGWNGQPLAPAFVTAAVALVVVPIFLLARLATADGGPVHVRHPRTGRPALGCSRATGGRMAWPRRQLPT